MIAVLLLIPFPFVSAANADVALTVNVTPPIYYENVTGERFVAKYGSFSDGSLHFVKIKMPDGHEYTLPQVLSGSGVRDIRTKWKSSGGNITVWYGLM